VALWVEPEEDFGEVPARGFRLPVEDEAPCDRPVSDDERAFVALLRELEECVRELARGTVASGDDLVVPEPVQDRQELGGAFTQLGAELAGARVGLPRLGRCVSASGDQRVPERDLESQLPLGVLACARKLTESVERGREMLDGFPIPAPYKGMLGGCVQVGDRLLRLSSADEVGRELAGDLPGLLPERGLEARADVRCRRGRPGGRRAYATSA
jgi:hypothetical protein